MGNKTFMEVSVGDGECSVTFDEVVFTGLDRRLAEKINAVFAKVDALDALLLDKSKGCDDATSRADKLTSELEDLKKRLDEAEIAKTPSVEDINRRVKLVADVEKMLSVASLDASLVEKSDAELKRHALVTKFGAEKFDGKDDAYVSVWFDAALNTVEQAPTPKRNDVSGDFRASTRFAAAPATMDWAGDVQSQIDKVLEV